MSFSLLDSERVYVDLFAVTGRWRVKTLPRLVAEEGYRQRAIHKSYRDRPAECPCSGCERRRKGFEIVLDYSANAKPTETSEPVRTSGDDPRLVAMRRDLERMNREKKQGKRNVRKP